MVGDALVGAGVSDQLDDLVIWIILPTSLYGVEDGGVVLESAKRNELGHIGLFAPIDLLDLPPLEGGQVLEDEHPQY